MTSALSSRSALEPWISKLFHMMMKDVPDGYGRISLQQVLKADKEFWTKLAELTRAGIQPRMRAPRPLDGAIAVASIDPEILFMLLPLPVKVAAPHQPKPEKEKRSWQGQGQGQGQRQRCPD